MPDYRMMYIEAFNALSEIIETAQQAQLKVEDLYISSEEKALDLFEVIQIDSDEQNKDSK